jgi:Chemotaxis phosphatase CheX
MAELGISWNETVTMAVEVWRSFLGIEIDIVSAGEPVNLPPTIISAAVTLKGDWYGGALLSYPVALADQAARLALGTEEPTLDDMRDVTGELLTMFVGRLRYYLSSKTEMSLPVIATGDTIALWIAGAKEALTADFRIEGVPFELQLVIADS